MLKLRGKFTRLIVPVVGGLGILWALFYSTVLTKPTELPPKQIGLPPVSTYSKTISGAGLIEANTRNIVVGAPIPGIVHEVLVTEGDVVTVNQPLFRLDDRTAQANLNVATGEVVKAKAQIAESEAALDDQRDQLKRAEKLQLGISVTADRIERLRYAVRNAVARLESSKAMLQSSEAQLQSARVILDKMTVNAPVSGRILKVKIRAGEYVESNATSEALVMGNDSPLHVRVSLDENDIWRLPTDAKATGALRSNRDISFPLTLVRIEPYVIPKRSPTGSLSERVDTRILEAVFSIGDYKDANKLYIGQQVDVFVDAG